MSQTITIRKGLDINMKGKAEKVLVESTKSNLFSIQPPNFQGLTPKLVSQADINTSGVISNSNPNCINAFISFGK